KDCIFVAHNASFDIGFLNAGYKQIKYEKVSNPVIDTLELARFILPELKNHRLNTLCNILILSLRNIIVQFMMLKRQGTYFGSYYNWFKRKKSIIIMN